MSNSILDSLGGDTGSSISSALDSIQPILTAATIIGTILTIIFCIYFVVGLVHKRKVQSAILRIDKNVQKLTDFMVGTENPHESEKTELVEVHDIKEKPLEPIEKATNDNEPDEFFEKVNSEQK